MTTIKPTTDIDQVINLLNLNNHYFGGADPTKMRKSVEEGMRHAAYINDQMVGCIVYQQLNEEAYEIVWFAIHPEFQGQGIGSKLLITSISQLPQSCRLIEVKTLSEIDPDPCYARTRNFYKKHGFISLETIHPYPGWGDDNPCQIFVKIR